MKLKNEITTETIDKQTGEVTYVTTHKTFNVKVSPDKFYMTYIDSLSSFYKLRFADDIKLLTKFCEIAAYNTGEVNLPAAKRREIEVKLGIGQAAFSRSTKRLNELGLIKGERGAYIVNPKIFWKGSLKEREALIKKGGLSFKVEIKNKYD